MELNRSVELILKINVFTGDWLLLSLELLLHSMLLKSILTKPVLWFLLNCRTVLEITSNNMF